ncbi:MAG: aminotransferase class I/II-fold pyridoxal phosphate-dependent enzyme [Thermoanaerobaculia bacterium]
MTRLHAQVGGVNLAQGLPDFEPPRELLAALETALARPENHQYGFTWGLPELREAVARKTARINAIAADPETDVTITCGVSEAVAAAVLALTEPGDEVVILEPWYENYVPACVLAGVKPRFVALSEPDFVLDPGRLARAITAKTRLILVNTPGNPSGRVFSTEELSAVAGLCQRHGIVAITDEIYEHLWFDGHRHVSLGSLPGMEDRTVTLSGLGKAYAVTGWRVGWAVAAAPLTALLRKVHDYLTICAPTPFQAAGVAALALPESYYEAQRAAYSKRRRILLDALSAAGLTFASPEGAYYVMADAARLGWKDDTAFVDFLAREVGVIAVPGSSFYARGGGKTKARFNFAKKETTLRDAAARLAGADLRESRRRPLSG